RWDRASAGRVFAPASFGHRWAQINAQLVEQRTDPSPGRRVGPPRYWSRISSSFERTKSLILRGVSIQLHYLYQFPINPRNPVPTQTDTAWPSRPYCQGRNEMGSPAFLVQSGCGLEESSREPRTPLRSLRVGLLGMWGFLRGIGLVIRRQEFSPAHSTITVESAKVGAPCPSCGRVSRSRHSSYTRLLMDLPADGRTVNIQLLVRRFRCRNPACRRRVFAERFPQLVRPHARRTERLEN